MSWTTEGLYQLLPAIYRIRDSERGEPLKALISIIAQQASLMEADIAQLYENLFIETCDEWVVPYLGDLLGVRGLHTVRDDAWFSHRARVANTLRYRRRKGTATMLEQLARDTTGWAARAVEFFELLATTQHINHVRLHNHRTPDLRRTNELELLDTAFDTAAHTADVRHMASGRGWHNIPNIGLFLWRLQSYFIEGVSARQVKEGCFTFSPLGETMPLFNCPQTETTITHLAEEVNVPGLLRRRPLYDELEVRRQALAEEMGKVRTEKSLSLYAALALFRQAMIEMIDGLPPNLAKLQEAGASASLIVQLSNLLKQPITPVKEIIEVTHAAMIAQYTGPTVYFGLQPVIQVFIPNKDGDEFYQVLPEEILICDLSDLPVPQDSVASADWPRPSLTKSYQPSQSRQTQELQIKVAVDPVLGRLAFPAGVTPNAVKVSYAYGFSGDIGGGPYNRRASVEAALTGPDGRPRAINWQRGVSQEPDNPDAFFRSIADAVNAWNVWSTENSGKVGVITMLDNGTYNPPPIINVPDGSLLLIIAADERRAHIEGPITIQGIPNDTNDSTSKLVINGLLIKGQLIVRGNLGCLCVTHTTQLPPKNCGDKELINDGLVVEAKEKVSKIEITRSLCGPIIIRDTAVTPHLRIVESIVNGGSFINEDGAALAISANSTAIEVERATIFGEVNARTLEASNSIFTGKITVKRRQTGCIRFSYVPPDSQTPRRFRCQPDLASNDLPETEKQNVQKQLVASFVSEHYVNDSPHYVHFGYGQLSPNCALELRTGAEDGSEMGAFSFLQQPQRETNLRASLDEYLRFGLEAGLIFVDPVVDLNDSQSLKQS